MDLSPLNKNFLEALHKLKISIEFKDKTFDGLFDNVPENLDYFFNWFIENITPENIITNTEAAALVPIGFCFFTKEELENLFSSLRPTYEELRSLDPNYINILLRRDLIDLKTNNRRLSEIIKELHSLDDYLKYKYIFVKEESNSLKRELMSAREECNKANVSFSKKLEQAKEVLLKEPELNINFDVYKECLQTEANVFDQIEDLKLFSDDMYELSGLILSELVDDFAYVETSSILTQGFLLGKKKEIEALSRPLYKKSLQESLNESLMQSQLTNYEDVNKIMDDIKILESKLLEKHHLIGQNKVDEIIEQYFQDKTGMCESYIKQLNKCKNSLTCNNQFNETLLEILNKTMSNLEKGLSLRKNVYSKIEEHERDLTDSISNLELQSKRFKEVSAMRESPLLQAVKDVINIDKDFEKSEETFENLMNLMSSITGDTKFDVETLKKKLDVSIFQFFSKFLCGPTSEVLFTPVGALSVFQKNEGKEEAVLSYVKKIASDYLEAKNSKAVKDRKSLLLWIKFLTNVSAIKDN